MRGEKLETLNTKESFEEFARKGSRKIGNLSK